MKYVHPDIVIGEPIPEIEPRIDRDRLAMVRRWNRWWRWCCVVALIMVAVSVLVRTSLLAGIVMMAVLLVLWYVPVVHPTMRAHVRKIRQANRLRGMTRPRNWGIPFRDEAQTMVLNIAPVIFAPMLVSASSGLGSVMSYMGMYAFMGGFGVIVYGFFARQPGQISCKECSYPLKGLTIDCRCPECGVFVLAPNYTTDCPRIRSPWFMRIGLVTSALGAVLVYTSFANPAAFYAPFPRAVLLNLAPTDRKAFEHLINNPMTLEQTDQLIEKLVASDIHRDSAYMSYQQREWLGQQFAAGLLSDEQADRVLELADGIWIKAPSTGRVGEPITLGLDAGGEFDPADDMKPRYYFGGFIIEGDPTPHQRNPNPRSISLITRKLPVARSSRLPESYYAKIEAMRPLTYVFIPEQTGEITIRVRLVLAILPKVGTGMPEGIDWEDGEQMFQAEPLWIRTVDIEHTIAIEPGDGDQSGG